MANLIICSCGGTQAVDAAAIEAATGHSCSRLHTALCTREIDRAAAGIAAGAIVACQQEAATFAALAEEAGVAAPVCIDLRDRAGWSDQGPAAGPKMAALVADALLPRRPARMTDVESAGVCLVRGAAAVALPAAERLSEALAVTCLLTEPDEILPGVERRFDIAVGRLASATGSFGRFEISVDGFRALNPAGRGALGFGPPRDGAASRCDIIVDLSGATPLFPADHKRDGYLRANPGDIRAVERLLSEAASLVGSFEKTLFVRIEETLCAHSRAGQIGCTRCIDACPAGAISPAGEWVSVDPGICAGCGACSSVCPSGAIAYDDPEPQHLFRRLHAMGEAWRAARGAAGGGSPRLLVHDAEHGREMIALAARLGRGLPADVIPFEVGSLSTFGHTEMLVALAQGFAAVDVLLAPRTEREVAEAQLALAQALAEGVGVGAARLRFIEPPDPDAMSDMLYAEHPEPLEAEPVLPLGHRRDATRLAARALGPEVGTPIALPDGAPYGAVLVNRDTCTLCLSCAGLCPSGALGDNPDRPQLTFKEDACLQCGLCATICPEDAITLEPRLDLSDEALRVRVLHEEEPYNCIECGKAFGVRSTVERIVAKLEGKHALFTNSDNTRLIRMCDDCRVRAQYHSNAQPMAFGPRPRVRTTDDYLKEREKLQ